MPVSLAIRITTLQIRVAHSAHRERTHLQVIIRRSVPRAQMDAVNALHRVRIQQVGTKLAVPVLLTTASPIMLAPFANQAIIHQEAQARALIVQPAAPAVQQPIKLTPQTLLAVHAPADMDLIHLPLPARSASLDFIPLEERPSALVVLQTV